MNILSILMPIMDSLGQIVHYDAGFPVPFLIIGLVVILAIGAGIVFLIIFIVKLLKRLSKKTK